MSLPDPVSKLDEYLHHRDMAAAYHESIGAEWVDVYDTETGEEWVIWNSELHGSLTYNKLIEGLSRHAERLTAAVEYLEEMEELS